MSPIEQLLALADEKTLELAREMIGKENLALDIATAISGLCGSGARLTSKSWRNLLGSANAKPEPKYSTLA